jgi:hypothetical protein
MLAAAKIWRSLAWPPRDPSRYVIEVADEHGRVLYSIPFAAALEAVPEK